MTDYYYVDCEEYREALSARLDDEEGPEDARQPTDLHLEYCADCALWYDNAALITRRTRTTAAVSWPDVTDAVLARVPGGTSVSSSRLRVALGVVGAAQGASALYSLTIDGGYQTAAWNLAVAVGLCAVAARRAQPAALVPLLGTFVGVLSWGYLTGLVAGAAGVLSYLLSTVGLVLVVLLCRTPPDRRGPVPPAGAAARAIGKRDTDGEDDEDGADGAGGTVRTAIRRIQPTKAA